MLRLRKAAGLHIGDIFFKCTDALGLLSAVFG